MRVSWPITSKSLEASVKGVLWVLYCLCSAQNAIVFRDMYLQCPARNNKGCIKLSDFRLLSSMNRRGKFILQIYTHTIFSLKWTKFRKRKRLNPLFVTCQKILPLSHHCLIYKGHMITTTKQKYEARKQVCVVGHLLVIFFIVWPSGSLIEFKSRADSTFKSRMCRGILRDVEMKLSSSYIRIRF